MSNIFKIYITCWLIIFSSGNDKFELNGSFINSNITKVYLDYKSSAGKVIIDSSEVVNNKFKFEGLLSDGATARIYAFQNKNKLTDTSQVDFYLEPAAIDISIANNDFQSMIINEPKTKREQLLLEKNKTTIVQYRDSLIAITRYYAEWIRIEAENQLNKIILEEIKYELDFIKNNPGSFVAIERLNYRATKQPEWPSVDSFIQLYNGLSPLVKYSPEGRKLLNLLTKIVAHSVGKPIPAFEIQTIEGEIINPTLFKDSMYYLIDFWASWCIPCKEDFPKMKGLYLTFAKKGFEIISISTDQDSSLFHRSIKKEGIYIWKNARIIPKKETLYYPALPTKYLVNKDGIIIGRWRGGGEENMIALENMLREHLQ